MSATHPIDVRETAHLAVLPALPLAAGGLRVPVINRLRRVYRIVPGVGSKPSRRKSGRCFSRTRRSSKAAREDRRAFHPPGRRGGVGTGGGAATHARARRIRGARDRDRARVPRPAAVAPRVPGRGVRLPTVVRACLVAGLHPSPLRRARGAPRRSRALRTTPHSSCRTSRRARRLPLSATPSATPPHPDLSTTHLYSLAQVPRARRRTWSCGRRRS